MSDDLSRKVAELRVSRVAEIERLKAELEETSNLCIAHANRCAALTAERDEARQGADALARKQIRMMGDIDQLRETIEQLASDLAAARDSIEALKDERGYD